MKHHHDQSNGYRGSALTALILASLLALFCPLLASAQTAANGVVTGRIFNPATDEYLRNASVRIRETDQSVYAEDGGVYRFPSVTPGIVTVEVSYTGFAPAEARVRVIAGATVEQNFELVSSLRKAAADGETVKLEKFVVVAGVREGAAKAIMDQRNSMNITNIVASDVFGDVAEGNVGEFLKHMPGVSINLVEGEVRTVSLRGLGAEYTAVTLDGMSLASADANAGAAGDARAFGFEQASLSSMESIEVSKTISADVNANAPAGTINLRTKRAFDRAGRRVTIQANATAFGRELSLARSYGPDDNLSRKIRGGGIFEYSDVFLDKRLGVVLSISESNVFSEINRGFVSYNTTPTATDPRPAVPIAVGLVRGPRTNRRATATISTDYKLTPELILSLGFIHNKSDLWFYRRDITANTGGRSTISGDNPLLSFTTNSGRLSPNPIGVAKIGKATTFTPRFEFKRGGLTIDGRFAISDSVSTYDPRARGSFFQTASPTVGGIAYSASRSDLLSSDWQIRQITGPDIADGRNYTSPTLQTDDGRYNRVQFLSGDISATLKSSIGGLPIIWKTGVKKTQDTRAFEVKREAYLYNYTGPGAGMGAWAEYRSPYDYDLGALGSNIRAGSGAPVYYPAMQAIQDLFRAHPEYFTQVLTGANYYNAYIANKKDYTEDIDAAFIMATAGLSRKVTLRAGLRWEKTSGDSFEFNPLTRTEVVAAGYTVSGARATTVDGIKYQYESRPRVHRTGSYDNLFPSASLKYEPWRNFSIHLGYSSTIRRPTFRDVAGVWTIDDQALIVYAPNPNLKPEKSDNFSLRAAYYFEPVGILAVNFFQNSVRSLHRGTMLTPEEFGNAGDLGGLDLTGYRINTTFNSADDVVLRGMELEYSQSLSFLPGALRGLNVRANYTRNYADVIRSGMSGHAVGGGLGYTLGRASVNASANWHSNRPMNLTNTVYVRHRLNIDVGGSFRFTDRLSVFLNVRNILDEPNRTMQVFSDGTAAVRDYEIFGTNYTLGIKRVF